MPPWSPGTATGIGSLPGSDAREASAMVLGELPDFPHLPELPARGPGADMVGRSSALLIDMAVETVPSGWRFTDRPGRDMHRAARWLLEDLDALEEAAQGFAGPLKIQVAGPWTLAASIELRYGAKALADPGACRDITASLAEGIVAHAAEVRKRVPAATLVIQIDEPAVPAVLAGTVPTASAFSTLAAVDEPVVRKALATVLAAASDSEPIVHCCAAAAPVELFVHAGARALSLDFSTMPSLDEQALGAAIDNGLGLLAGIVPTADTALPERSATVEPVRAWWRRLGFAPDALAERVVATSACGLAGASPDYARAALKHCREAARVLVDAPEG